MVPIAAAAQVSVMTPKNTCCTYGLFWKLFCGSWWRVAVCLPICLCGQDGNRLISPERTGGFGFWDQSGSHAQGLVFSLRWRNVFKLLLRCFYCHCPMEPCVLLCCITTSASALWEGLRPGTQGKTAAKGMDISYVCTCLCIYMYIKCIYV